MSPDSAASLVMAPMGSQSLKRLYILAGERPAFFAGLRANCLPVQPNYHHRRGIELTVLKKKFAPLCLDLVIMLRQTVEHFLVSSHRARTLGDRFFSIVLWISEGKRWKRLIGIKNVSVAVFSEILSK